LLTWVAQAYYQSQGHGLYNLKVLLAR